MHFLPDVYVTCETCKGRATTARRLEMKFKGKSIADVLDMTVEERRGSSRRAVDPRQDGRADAGGLGLYQGRPAGDDAVWRRGAAGEAVEGTVRGNRRVARFISWMNRRRVCTFEDVRKLLEVLHELVDQGNSVVVIEHNLDVVKTADCIIDIGPEGGDGGGRIVADGHA